MSKKIEKIKSYQRAMEAFRTIGDNKLYLSTKKALFQEVLKCPYEIKETEKNFVLEYKVTDDTYACFKIGDMYLKQNKNKSEQKKEQTPPKNDAQNQNRTNDNPSREGQKEKEHEEDAPKERPQQQQQQQNPKTQQKENENNTPKTEEGPNNTPKTEGELNNTPKTEEEPSYAPSQGFFVDEENGKPEVIHNPAQEMQNKKEAASNEAPSSFSQAPAEPQDKPAEERQPMQEAKEPVKEIEEPVKEVEEPIQEIEKPKEEGPITNAMRVMASKYSLQNNYGTAEITIFPIHMPNTRDRKNVECLLYIKSKDRVWTEFTKLRSETTSVTATVLGTEVTVIGKVERGEFALQVISQDANTQHACEEVLGKKDIIHKKAHFELEEITVDINACIYENRIMALCETTNKATGDMEERSVLLKEPGQTEAIFVTDEQFKILKEGQGLKIVND